VRGLRGENRDEYDRTDVGQCELVRAHTTDCRCDKVLLLGSCTRLCPIRDVRDCPDPLFDATARSSPTVIVQ